MKKLTLSIDDLVRLFFDDFKAPCKKGEHFDIDGEEYVCTRSSKGVFEYRPAAGGSKTTFTSF